MSFRLRKFGTGSISPYDFVYAAGASAGIAVRRSSFSVPCLVVWNHRRKCGTSYHHIGRPVKTSVPCDHLDVLTAEMELAIVLSTIKEGMSPPRVLDVAMRHSAFPLRRCLNIS